eukprot:3280024-Lingulodinium_polyedra.AAC.1
MHMHVHDYSVDDAHCCHGLSTRWSGGERDSVLHAWQQSCSKAAPPLVVKYLPHNRNVGPAYRVLGLSGARELVLRPWRRWMRVATYICTGDWS